MRSASLNLLTLSRIPLAIIVLFTYRPSERIFLFPALLIIFLALGTDYLDGYLARRYKLASETGYILDGLADRSFYIALVLTMTVVHSLSLVIAWLLIVREVLMYALRLLEHDHWFEANPSIRKLSLWHAGTIRIWFLTYFAGDVVALVSHVDLYGYVWYKLLQLSLLGLTLFVGYTSVLRLVEQALKEPTATR